METRKFLDSMPLIFVGKKIAQRKSQKVMTSTKGFVGTNYDRR